MDPSIADLDDTKNLSMISFDHGAGVFHEITVAPQRSTTTVAPLERVAVILSPFSWTGIDCDEIAGDRRVPVPAAENVFTNTYY